MTREKQQVPLDERIRKIKAAYPLGQFIEGTGAKLKSSRSSRHWMFMSPLRDDGSRPGFSVDVENNTWHDFGLEIGGDIFDFIREYQGLEFYPALCQLEDQAGYLPPAQERRDPPRREIKEIPLSRVMDAAKYADFSVPYWESQHITRDTVHYNLMGTDRLSSLMGFRAGHKIQYGKHIGEYISGECMRYTIPNIRPNSKTMRPMVISVNSRRDDESARRCLERMDQRQVQMVRDDLMYDHELRAKRWNRSVEEVTESDLMDAIFGAKYLYWKNSTYAIFNLHLIYSWQGNGICVPRDLDYVIVVEGEKCALALTDAGYPAIAIKPSTRLDLRSAIGHIPLIFWAYDGDEAGSHFTETAIDMVGGSRLPIPNPHKDPTDVIVAEQQDRWLSQYSIYPIDRRYLAAPTWLRNL